ncbi:hypothetical protein AQUCO_01200197v1 [Aquilegia coerulea]|uniref:Uncharacterized protein n=1 Tax=Aquilegia coerulea TaxID=218851 RepID=A0A2G5E4X4_AQUCA|nr:hypothetical protein AQUCO_01200197v1 [Aquilegia coerulea]
MLHPILVFLIVIIMLILMFLLVHFLDLGIIMVLITGLRKTGIPTKRSLRLRWNWLRTNVLQSVLRENLISFHLPRCARLVLNMYG